MLGPVCINFPLHFPRLFLFVCVLYAGPIGFIIASHSTGDMIFKIHVCRYFIQTQSIVCASHKMCFFIRFAFLIHSVSVCVRVSICVIEVRAVEGFGELCLTSLEEVIVYILCEYVTRV